ncbi:MAG: hypothetical protein WBM43_10905 [Flavobacteriaceae bacterium]
MKHLSRIQLLSAIAVFGFSVLSAEAQQLFHMKIDENQRMETLHGSSGLLFDVPVKDGTVILAGQYDKEGLGQHLVFNGGRLLIENMVMGNEGQRHVTLRLEDRRNFYNMFPTIKATLIPVVDVVINDLESESEHTEPGFDDVETN